MILTLILNISKLKEYKYPLWRLSSGTKTNFQFFKLTSSDFPSSAQWRLVFHQTLSPSCCSPPKRLEKQTVHYIKVVDIRVLKQSQSSQVWTIISLSIFIQQMKNVVCGFIMEKKVASNSKKI